jgi:DNA recombination protein RmuC
MAWLAAIAGGVALVAVAAAVLVALSARARAKRAAAGPAGAPPEVLEGLARLAGLVEGRLGVFGESQDGLRRAVEALYTKAGHRGRWGELTLRRLLEAAGMTPGVDFHEQVDLGGEARPDVVVHLGGAGEVVVDAKAPLDGLRRAWESETEEVRLGALRDHARAVKQYAADLRRRGYAARLQAPLAPVVMFLPIEGAWEAAEEVQADLLLEVLRLGIYPASPRTLGLVVELLRHQALTLDQDRAARAIVCEGRTLVDRIGVHVKHLAAVGKAVNAAAEAFNAAAGNLESRVLPAARRVAEMVPEGRPAAEVVLVERRAQTERLESLVPGAAA